MVCSKTTQRLFQVCLLLCWGLSFLSNRLASSLRFLGHLLGVFMFSKMNFPQKRRKQIWVCALHQNQKSKIFNVKSHGSVARESNRLPLALHYTEQRKVGNGSLPLVNPQFDAVWDSIVKKRRLQAHRSWRCCSRKISKKRCQEVCTFRGAFSLIFPQSEMLLRNQILMGKMTRSRSGFCIKISRQGMTVEFHKRTAEVYPCDILFRLLEPQLYWQDDQLLC